MLILGRGSPLLDLLLLCLFLPILGLGHCPLGRPLYNAHTGPDWPVGGDLVYETRDPVLLVGGKVRHAQGQRLNRFEVEVEVRRKRKRTKGEGEESTLFPLFLTPHF